MATGRVVLTYEDYCAIPDDGLRYELHDGALSVTPAPGPPHQRIGGNLYVTLREHVTSRGLGEVLYAPVDVILSNTTVVQPDLVYIDPTRQALVSARAIEGPPTLAVEIVSPSTPRIDRTVKLALCARYAVPYDWVVDPGARTIDAYELAEDVYRLVTTARGDTAVSLPPFPDLPLVPESMFT